MVVSAMIVLSGCSVHNGLTTNANLNSTEVVLAKNNFTVLASVQGKSEALYVFGLGGFTKNGMIAEARARMLAEADLIGGSRAIINETVEIKHSFFPVVRLYTVLVSGYVVEFNE